MSRDPLALLSVQLLPAALGSCQQFLHPHDHLETKEGVIFTPISPQVFIHFNTKINAVMRSYLTGFDVSGQELCGTRWLTEAAGERHPERSARRPSPPDSARRLCPPPYACRAEIL